jgi:hypothetical protein
MLCGLLGPSISGAPARTSSPLFERLERFWYGRLEKVTAYFAAMRTRPDRAVIRDEWIERAVHSPIRERVQSDGRIRRWIQVPDMEGRYLRVILMPDGETVHNAFFDRGFKP